MLVFNVLLKLILKDKIMDIYIYQADLYCADCISKITKSLAPNEIPGDENTYDSDEYPKGPYPDGGGEADTPQHCGNQECGCFLENPLTSVGYDYIHEALQDKIEKDPILAEWFEYYGFRIESNESY